MDSSYKKVLDLLYIANSEVLFNENINKYDADTVLGSEDTWKRFWELAEKNNLLDECSDYLRDKVLTKWSERDFGKNWWTNRECYVGWDQAILPLLGECGYPLDQNYLVMYPQQLEKSETYKQFRIEEKQKLEEIKPLYNL